MIFGQNIKGYDPDDDPLFRLQFLARITVQAISPTSPP